MLSVQNVRSTAMPAQGAGGVVTPETGEFDFLSYLLGLQASQLDETGGLENAILGNGNSLPNSETTGEAEISTEDKSKEASQWNPIFPGLNVNVGNLVSKQVPTGVDSNQRATLVRNAIPQHESFPGMANSSQNRQELGAFAVTGAKGVDVIQAQTITTSPGHSNREAAQKYVFADQLKSDVGLAKTIQAVPEQIPEIEPDGEMERRKTTHAFDGSALFAQQSPNGVTANVNGPEQGTHQASSIPELFNRVESMVHHGGGKMTVHLSPPELGQVEVEVTARGNRVEIEMRSDNESAKSILESRLGDLKQSIQSQDLVLSKMEVHVGRESSSLGENSFANFNQGSGAFNQSTFSGFTNQNQNRNREFSVVGEAQKPSFLSRETQAVRTATARANGRVDLRI